jgi:hypothetical protein
LAKISLGQKPDIVLVNITMHGGSLLRGSMLHSEYCIVLQ